MQTWLQGATKGKRLVQVNYVRIITSVLARENLFYYKTCLFISTNRFRFSKFYPFETNSALI